MKITYWVFCVFDWIRIQITLRFGKSCKHEYKYIRLKKTASILINATLWQNQRHRQVIVRTNIIHCWSADLRDRMKMLRGSRRCKKTIERYKNTMQTSLLTNGLEAPKAADSYEGVVNSNRPLIASTRWSKKCKRRWWRIWHNAKDYDRFLKMKLILQSMNLVLNIFEIYHSINENET